jgi:hypothetical protein
MARRKTKKPAVAPLHKVLRKESDAAHRRATQKLKKLRRRIEEAALKQPADAGR